MNLILVIATFVLGLIVDQYAGLAGQLAVSVWTWGVFFWLLRTSPHEWRQPFYACLVWATAGEIFLSLVWRLYTYRLENIPLFIPPGHVLLFYLGLVLAPRVPRAFVALVPTAAVGYAAFAWINGVDTISIALIVLFTLCMLQPEGRRLYAVMFVASLMVEVYGTWIGNWVWDRDVPYLGLNSANPPLAAGAFYCALDVLVGLTVRAVQQRSRAAALSTASYDRIICHREGWLWSALRTPPCAAPRQHSSLARPLTLAGPSAIVQGASTSPSWTIRDRSCEPTRHAFAANRTPRATAHALQIPYHFALSPAVQSN